MTSDMNSEVNLEDEDEVPAGVELLLQRNPLSAGNFAIYNRFAEKMGRVHNGFRDTWIKLKEACVNKSSTITSESEQESEAKSQVQPKDVSDYMEDEDLIMLGLSFCAKLSEHHAIEERYLFPLLAERMPEFAVNGVLADQHKVIHEGIVRLRGYLESCERYIFEDNEGELEGMGLDRDVLRGIMMGEEGAFERVLWQHLDREVEALRAEHMRMLWRVDEVQRIPF